MARADNKRSTDLETIEVVAAVITRNGAVLAMRRSGNRSHAGRWECPGGRVEPGESHRQALIREIQEELNQAILVCIPLTTIELTTKRAHLTVHFLHVHGTFDVPELRVHDAYCWLTADQLHDVAWSEADNQALRHIEPLLRPGSHE